MDHPRPAEDAEALRESLPRWPRHLLGSAFDIAERFPDVRVRHELMARVFLRLEGQERAAALDRLLASLARDTPQGRVAVLVELMEQGWKREGFTLARPLLAELDAWPSPDGAVLCRLVPWLDPEDLDRGISLAMRITPDSARAEALAAFLRRPRLPDRTAVVRVLRGLLPLREASPSRWLAIMDAVARSIPAEDVPAFLPLVPTVTLGQDRVIGELAAKLDDGAFDIATDLAFALPDPRARRAALSQLARHATPPRARKLLARAFGTAPPGPRTGRIQGDGRPLEREEAGGEVGVVVTSLSQLAVADLPAWAHAEPGGPAIAALVAALPRIGAASHGETLGLLRGIADGRARGEALVAYAVHAAKRADLPRAPLLSEAAQLLGADPRVLFFLRKWGDRLRVLSAEEVLGAVREPVRLLRLIWPNLPELGRDARSTLLPLVRELAPPAEIAELEAALAEAREGR